MAFPTRGIMDDFTIISYPGIRDESLLSLTEDRSKYLLPFGGRFRVVDFTIRNSSSSGARHTIIYNNREDDLESYVENYGPFKDRKFPAIKVVSRDYSDVRLCYNLVMDSNTDYYIIYNGDNPSIIDFAGLIEKYKKKKKAGAMLFSMKTTSRESMAYTILITNQKSLLSVINEAMDEGRHAPNLFEMIINALINRGIKSEMMSAHYWPIKSIPDYYRFNMTLMKSRDLFSRVFGDPAMKGFIPGEGFAFLGKHARVSGSFVSDNCVIKGTVQNSIIFPGVEIDEKATVMGSIVLPYNRIGAGASVVKTVIDERTPPRADVPSDSRFTIGNRCNVGSEHEQLKSKDFPKSIYQSITLIGKDSRIPDGARIGGACYVSSGRGDEYFARSKYLYDGLSVVK